MKKIYPGYGLCHFKNGWLSLGQIEGKNIKYMARVLLGYMIGKVPRNVIISYRSFK